VYLVFDWLDFDVCIEASRLVPPEDLAGDPADIHFNTSFAMSTALIH
jgi:hypothetical protein